MIAQATQQRAPRAPSSSPSDSGTGSRRHPLGDPGLFLDRRARRRRHRGRRRRQRLALPEGARRHDDRILPELRPERRGHRGRAATPQRAAPAPAPRPRATWRGSPAPARPGLAVGRSFPRPGGRGARPRPCCRPARRSCRRAAGCRDRRARARGRGRCRCGARAASLARRASAADRYQAKRIGGHELQRAVEIRRGRGRRGRARPGRGRGRDAPRRAAPG